MSDQEKQEKKNSLVTTVQRSDIIAVENANPLFDTAAFEHLQRAAMAISESTLLPEAIQGKTPRETFGNLMLVFEKALRWNMPAMDVAQCVGIVHGKLVYEGKLIAAVLESKGVKLKYEWTGTPADGDTYAIKVSGTPRGAAEPESIEGTVGDWKTYEKSGALKGNWKGANAKRQLAYRGAREWCRLYEPAILLGVYSDDEIDEARSHNFGRRAESTPKPSQLSAGFADQDAEDADYQEKVDALQSTEPDCGPHSTAAETAELQKSEKTAETAQEAAQTDPRPETPAEPEAAASAPENEPSAEKPAEEPEPKAKGDFHAEAQSMRDTRLDTLQDFPQLREFWMTIAKFEDWPALRQALNEIARTEDWTRAAQVPGQALISGIRAAAFHQAQMIAEEEHATDPVYFRLYVEAEEAPAALSQVFDEFKKSKAWNALKENHHAIFTGAVDRRLKELTNG